MIAMNIFGAAAPTGMAAVPPVEDSAVCPGDLGFAAAMTVEAVPHGALGNPALIGTTLTLGHFPSVQSLMPTPADGLPGEIHPVYLPQHATLAEAAALPAASVSNAVLPGLAPLVLAALPQTTAPLPDGSALGRSTDKSPTEVTLGKSPKAMTGKPKLPQGSPKHAPIATEPLSVRAAQLIPVVAAPEPLLIVPSMDIEPAPANRVDDRPAPVADAQTNPPPLVIDRAPAPDRTDAVITVPPTGIAVTPPTQGFQTEPPGHDPAPVLPGPNIRTASPTGLGGTVSASDQTGARPEPVSPKPKADAAPANVASAPAPLGDDAETTGLSAPVSANLPLKRPAPTSQPEQPSARGTSHPAAKHGVNAAPLVDAAPRNPGNAARSSARVRPDMSAQTPSDRPPQARSAPDPAARQSAEPPSGPPSPTATPVKAISAASANQPSQAQPGPSHSPRRPSAPIDPNLVRPVGPRTRLPSGLPTPGRTLLPQDPMPADYRLTWHADALPVPQQSATPELRRGSSVEHPPLTVRQAPSPAPDRLMAAPPMVEPPGPSARTAIDLQTPPPKVAEGPATRAFASPADTNPSVALPASAGVLTNANWQSSLAKTPTTQPVLQPSQPRATPSDDAILTATPIAASNPHPALVRPETSSAPGIKQAQPARSLSKTALPVLSAVIRHDLPTVPHIQHLLDASPRHAWSAGPATGPTVLGALTVSPPGAHPVGGLPKLLPGDAVRQNDVSAKPHQVAMDPPAEHPARHVLNKDDTLLAQASAIPTTLADPPSRAFAGAGPLKRASGLEMVADAVPLPFGPRTPTGETRAQSPRDALPDPVAAVQPDHRPVPGPQRNETRSDFAAQAGHPLDEVRDRPFPRVRSDRHLPAPQADTALHPPASSGLVPLHKDSRIDLGLVPSPVPLTGQLSPGSLRPDTRSMRVALLTEGLPDLQPSRPRIATLAPRGPTTDLPPQDRSTSAPPHQDQAERSMRHQDVFRTIAAWVPSPALAADMARIDPRAGTLVGDAKQRSPVPTDAPTRLDLLERSKWHQDVSRTIAERLPAPAFAPDTSRTDLRAAALAGDSKLDKPLATDAPTRPDQPEWSQRNQDVSRATADRRAVPAPAADTPRTDPRAATGVGDSKRDRPLAVNAAARLDPSQRSGRHQDDSRTVSDRVPAPVFSSDTPWTNPRVSSPVGDGQKDAPLPLDATAPIPAPPAMPAPLPGRPEPLQVPDAVAPASDRASPTGLHDIHGLPRHLPASLVQAASRADRDDRVELLLDPVELGRVRFELTSSADRVQVNVSVERPETLDLLRRNVDSLRAEFREAGFDAATLCFSQWGKGGDPSPDAPFTAPDLSSDVQADDSAEPTPQPARNTSRHGLDLRL